MKRLLLSILAVLMLGAFTSPVQGQQDQTFDSFWTQFKTAVAKNDKEAVASMTRFPILCWNENLTRDAFLGKYNKKFVRKFQECIAEGKPVNDHQADVELRKKYPDPTQPRPDTGSYSVFSGGDMFMFEKKDGRYLLTGVGYND